MIAPPLTAVSPKLVEKALLISESTPSQLPNEFPYEFAFTSPEDSTETEDETTDDEDDFLAGLTRRLALSTRLSSPDKVKPTESTRSGLGSPNGPFSQAPSPPASPFSEEDSLKVISAAAGEVAKIKMANFDATKPISRPIEQNPNPLIPFPPPQNAAFYDHSYYYWLWQSQLIHSHNHQSQIRFDSTTLQPALIASPYPTAVNGVFPPPNAVKPVSKGTGVFTALNAVKPAASGTGVFTALNAVKPASVGTGVFLPRKYPNPSDSKKKPGGGCVKIPSKKVVHSKTEEVSGRCQANSQAHSKINNVGGGGLKEEKHLPQEWMY